MCAVANAVIPIIAIPGSQSDNSILPARSVGDIVESTILRMARPPMVVLRPQRDNLVAFRQAGCTEFLDV